MRQRGQFVFGQRRIGQLRAKLRDDFVDHLRLVQNDGARNGHRQSLLLALDDDVEFLPQPADRIVVVACQQVDHCGAYVGIGMVDQGVRFDRLARRAHPFVFVVYLAVGRVFHPDAVLVQVGDDDFGYVQFDDLLAFDILEVLFAVLDQVFYQLALQFVDAAAGLDRSRQGIGPFAAATDQLLTADELLCLASGSSTCSSISIWREHSRV